MPAHRLRDYLDRNDVRYAVIRHAPAYTAQEAAAAAHVPGREMAKSVVLRVDGRLGLAVTAASDRVDLERVRTALRTRDVALAAERDFRDRFPDCDLGAMPPFGNLYGMTVWVSEDLDRGARLAFPAGTHAEMIVLRYDDYKRLVRPAVLPLSAPRG